MKFSKYFFVKFDRIFLRAKNENHKDYSKHILKMILKLGRRKLKKKMLLKVQNKLR